MTPEPAKGSNAPSSTVAERVGTIKNPLTIIAIFAGIAELSGTIVLPLLKDNVQSIFVYFVMAFPVVLVVMFFNTLNRRHHVLYAPSDYRDDATFRSTFNVSKPSYEEIEDKIGNETVIEADQMALNHENPPTPPLTEEQQISSNSSSLSNIINRTRKMEKNVLNLISQERGVAIERGRKVTFSEKSYIIFDGTYNENGHLTAIEIFRWSPVLFRRIDDLINKIIVYTNNDPGPFKMDIIIYGTSEDQRRVDLERLHSNLWRAKFPINIRFINTDQWE